MENKKNPEQENQKTDFSKIYSEIDNAPIHTMEDDLNALQGISAPEKKEPAAAPYRTEKNSQPIPTPPSRPSIHSHEKPPDGHYSPFLNPSGSIPEKRETAKAGEPAFSAEKTAKHLPWNRIMITTVVFLAFAAIAFGGYYFWTTRKPDVLPPITEEREVPEPPVAIEPQPKKYSLENPNILQINTDTAASSIIEQLNTVGQELKEESPEASLVEFVIRDEKNNPVDFSIFSILASLKLDYILAYLGDDFSIYLYPEKDKTRAILSVEIKENGEVKKLLLANEKTMASDLSFLFLGQSPAKTTGVLFSENSSSAYPVRYANFDAEMRGDLSIDYFLTDDRLVIATSKNSASAFLEKIEEAKISANPGDAPAE